MPSEAVDLQIGPHQTSKNLASKIWCLESWSSERRGSTTIMLRHGWSVVEIHLVGAAIQAPVSQRVATCFGVNACPAQRFPRYFK